jgi:hypothetical protein
MWDDRVTLKLRPGAGLGHGAGGVGTAGGGVGAGGSGVAGLNCSMQPSWHSLGTLLPQLVPGRSGEEGGAHWEVGCVFRVCVGGGGGGAGGPAGRRGGND